ncbi:MAG: ferredoxin family protein [Deltaproteobacteria bacterium]|nr:ferredoxin family protein [Deltaproteobacteria bacterium]
MTFVIASACVDVKDKSCIEVCPVNCIYTDPDDRMCFIHPTECIDCGVCESACPVQAIFPGNAVPSESSEYTALNALWFEDKSAARATVNKLKPST